mgnify:CR=1 FL=1
MQQVQDAARKHTELAMKTLAEIAGDAGTGASARVAASEALLDRGWGKAPQTVEMTGINALPEHVIDAILTALETLDAESRGAAKDAPGTPGPESATAH